MSWRSFSELPSGWLLAATLLLSGCGDSSGFAGSQHNLSYFAYVTNKDSGSITSFSIKTGGFLIPMSSISSGGSQPVAIAQGPGSKYVYALNAVSGVIGIFSVDPATGSLNQSSSASAQATCNGFDLDPAGRYLYLACTSGIGIFNMDSGGALSGFRTVSAVDEPYSVRADPGGSYVYVLSRVAGKVSSYAISGGALALVDSESVGNTPVDLAVDPGGRYLVTANSGTADATVVTVNQGTGALSVVGSYAAASTPSAVAISRTGDVAYVTNKGANSLSAFTVRASDFALVPLATYTTDVAPSAIGFSPDGTFGIVAHAGTANDVYCYKSASDGTLANGDLGAAESGPSAVTVLQMVLSSPF